MGRILQSAIYTNLEGDGLFTDSQPGFVHGRSCFPNLITIFQEVIEASAVDVDCMDFSKSFDAVLHGSLIQKIKMHGIPGDLNV